MKPCTRRSFIRRTACAGLLTAGGSFSIAAERQPTKMTNNEILSQCPDRIRKYRIGEGTLGIHSADGKPVPQARVRLEQIGHEFLFGSNIFGFGQIQNAELQEQYNRRFADLLNYATLPFYWPMYEPQRGQANHTRTEKTVDWCLAHKIKCKGHPLVWDFADPRWLPRDFEEIGFLSHARVTDCMLRFAGKIDRWDVVNEPTHLGRFGTRLGEWAQSIGAVPYVRQHLVTARKAGPKSTLLVNDYRTDQPFYDILDKLRDDKKLMFDVVGIQSHMHQGVWPLQRVWQVCDTYAKLGLPVHFTETTVVSGPFKGRDTSKKSAIGDNEIWGETTPELEDTQAEKTVQFYTTLFAHPAVEAITWWDFSDLNAWKRAPAGWLRKDMSTKPVYEQLMKRIKGEWWSKQNGVTDGMGQMKTNLYYGDYQITITLPNGNEIKQQFSWSKQSDRNLIIKI